MAMMIARPTAASAAATVIVKTTNTWPAAPYSLLSATKDRFTALSINSTHMKIMIALRRVRTPMTPIVNRTADRARASTSIGPPLAEHHGAHDRGEQEHARQLEGQQVLLEERRGHWANDAARHRGGRCLGRLRGQVRRDHLVDRVRAIQRHHFGEHRETHEERQDVAPLAP